MNPVVNISTLSELHALAKVMVEVALQPMRQEICENEDMRRHSVAKG